MKHTNKTGKFAIAMTTLFLLAFVFPLSVFAKPEKVSVCHWDADNELYELISISERALDAQLAQGGVLPGTEGLDENCSPLADTDGDGIPDADDSDDDNDGQTDADESACGSDPLDAASMAADFDGDNSPDCVDSDDDNDGVDDVDDAFPFDPARSTNCPVDPLAEAAPGVNWSGCIFDDGANLSGANLSGANLFGTHIEEADLTNVDFSNADLGHSNLNRADLSGADLSGANLELASIAEVNLTDANLTGANVAGAWFAYATWSNTTCPDGTNSDDRGGSCYL